MKKYFLRIVTGVMLAGMFLLTNAQSDKTISVKPTTRQSKESLTKRANVIVEHIASIITLSNEQKSKLQPSLQEAIAAYDAAMLKANEDGAKSSAAKSNLLADVTAKIKAVLTPEQFAAVMSREDGALD